MFIVRPIAQKYNIILEEPSEKKEQCRLRFKTVVQHDSAFKSVKSVIGLNPALLGPCSCAVT